MPVEKSIVLKFYTMLREEINSPFNEWVTGESVGHTPAFEEKLIHFEAHGGHRGLRERFFRENPGARLLIA